MELGRPRGSSQTLHLEKVSLARLFFALLHQRFTGTLQLDQPEPAGTRTVWWDGGSPVFTDWVSQRLALGDVLVQEGLIRPDQLSQVLGMLHTEGGLLGPLLVRTGMLDRQGLADGLRRQCARKLVDLFAVRAGMAVLTSGSIDAPETLGKVNVLGLIYAGVCAHYDPMRVAAEMGPELDGSMALTSAVGRYLSYFQFRPDDEGVLKGLTTRAEFDTLARLPGVTAAQAARVVYTLWACKMLRVGAAADVQDGESIAIDLKAAAAARRTGTMPPVSGRTPTNAPVGSGAAAARPQPADGRAAAAQDGQRRTTGTIPPTGDGAAQATAPGGRAAADPRRPTPGDEGTAEKSNDEFLVDLVALEARIRAGVNPFALLGIGVDSGKREVKRAFAELSRSFHPDAMQARGLGHVRERVGSVFAALSEAQMLLSDADKREQIRAAVEAGVQATSSADATAMARAAFESDVLFREGDKFLRGNRFDRALECYRRARTLTPDEPELTAVTAWCEFNLSGRSRDDMLAAERAIAEVLAHAPNIARAHYFRGMLLKELGVFDQALNALRRAMQLDPRLIDAERQARGILAAKSEADARGKGLMGLFGKK